MSAADPDPHSANVLPPPANPFSTGVGGTVFELHVQASLVATLLVRGFLPCLPPNQITAVHLQAGHLGLRTDDVTCEAVDEQRRERRLISQVKHQIEVSSTNAKFKAAVAAGWLDFRAMNDERRALDSFALITGPISSAVAWDFRTMLEWARSAFDAADFFRRMAIPKYASNTARAHLGTIREICNEANGAAVSDDDFWQFLRRYHLLSFDFDVVGSQDLARVKTMLALVAEPRDVASGDALWNKIFHLVSQQNPRAGTLTRETLPDDLTTACGSLAPHFDYGPVQRLREHANGVLRRIRMTIANMKPLPRDEPRRRLAEAVEEHPFVVVTGPAGAGKSALSHTAFEQSFADAPLFAFQAIEFARVHLDQVLSELRLTVDLKELSALFALHRRKCLLIDSVERLLETEPRDAFSMFLDQIAADANWRVVFTCRQYSLEQVQRAFFRPCGISPAIVEVPLFDGEELRIVAEAVPALAPLLSEVRTRRLLRNPYFLDKAALVNWHPDPSQPLDERRLRETLWRQVVMREDVRRDGLPLRRECCFRAVALRRAKTMRSFVPVTAGDEGAMQALLDDELLIRDTESGGVAPAHDVLEDWALVREVRMQFEQTAGQPTELFSALGHELAMRRSYRHWLNESLEDENLEEIFRFATATIRAAEVEAYWRDETLVSLMLSEHADRYVRSEESALLAVNKSLLRRAVHLLRVACKRPNPLLPISGERLVEVAQSLCLVPDGSGWDAVLQLIERNLKSFTRAELPWILGLLKDWRSSIIAEQPPPVAAREAELVALHYWRLTKDAYVNQDELHTLAGVLLAAPQAICAEFEELLEEIACAEWEYHNSMLAQRLLTSFDGIAACRALPAAVAKFARHAWGIDRPTPTRRKTRGSLRRDSWYGLSDEFHLRPDPASAIHGPFYFLLQGDPQIGLRLIVDLTNTAMERAATFGREESPDNEPVFVEVPLADGLTVRQLAAHQLWRIYREPGIGPDVVTCALMALEKWLLQLAESGADLGEMCRGLLAESNNVAVTAAVASVAIAHPSRVGDVALSLFRVREFFVWDQRRSIAERFRMDTLMAGIPIPAEHRIYDEERKQSAKLSHRLRNLEWLARELQLTEMRDAIQKIIDDHRAALPPEEAQSESMRTWRLLLHRGDLRRGTLERESGSGYLIFSPTQPEPDLQRMVEEHLPIAAAKDEQMRLMNWGLACFNRKTEHHDPSRWPEMLASSELLTRKLPEDADEHEWLMVCYAGAYIAAVCVRDHWQEMMPEQRAWCRSLILKAVKDQEDSRDEFVEASRLPMHDSRPAAWVLPLLLCSDSEEENSPIRRAIAGALTHASVEVRDFAVCGVRDYLWEREPQTAWACAAGLVRWSQIRREFDLKERQRLWNERQDFAETARARLPELRALIAAGSVLQPEEVLRLDLSDWCGQAALRHLLLIIGGQTQSELARRFHRHVAEGLVHLWVGGPGREQRNYEAETAGAKHLALFMLRAPPAAADDVFQPIVEAIGSHPAKVAQCLKQLVIAEDQLQSGGVFWTLWQRIADTFLALERWENLLGADRGGPAHLIEALFLRRVEWKADARDWAPLHGHEHRLEALFSSTGHCPSAFAAFCGLLGSIGSRGMLPQAIILLSERLKAGEPRGMLAGKMTLWDLETVLSGCIYGTPSDIRRSPSLLSASIHVLDEMVEQGSSAAFRMREFIITPVSEASGDEGV